MPSKACDKKTCKRNLGKLQKTCTEQFPCAKKTYRQSAKRQLSLHGLVRKHTAQLKKKDMKRKQIVTKWEKVPTQLNKTTYSSPKDSGGGSEVEWAASRVGVHPLLDELCVLDLVSRYCTNNISKS